MPRKIAVLRHALTAAVHVGKAALGGGFPLYGGFFVPAGGLGVVLWHAPAVVVHDAQAELGEGVLLRGGLFVPLPGCVVVLRHAPAVIVQIAQTGLGGGMLLRGGLFVPLPGRVVVLRHAPAVMVQVAQAGLRGGMLPRGGRLVALPGRVVVLRHAVAAAELTAEGVQFFRVVLRDGFPLPPGSPGGALLLRRVAVSGHFVQTVAAFLQAAEEAVLHVFGPAQTRFPAFGAQKMAGQFVQAVRNLSGVRAGSAVFQRLQKHVSDGPAGRFPRVAVGVDGVDAGPEGQTQLVGKALPASRGLILFFQKITDVAFPEGEDALRLPGAPGADAFIVQAGVVEAVFQGVFLSEIRSGGNNEQGLAVFSAEVRAGKKVDIRCGEGRPGRCIHQPDEEIRLADGVERRVPGIRLPVRFGRIVAGGVHEAEMPEQPVPYGRQQRHAPHDFKQAEITAPQRAVRQIQAGLDRHLEDAAPAGNAPGNGLFHV